MEWDSLVSDPTTGLVATNGSPWATYQEDLADAENTRTIAVTNARETRDTIFADAYRDEEYAISNAEEVQTLELADAAAVEQVQTTQAAQGVNNQQSAELTGLDAVGQYQPALPAVPAPAANNNLNISSASVDLFFAEADFYGEELINEIDRTNLTQDTLERLDENVLEEDVVRDYPEPQDPLALASAENAQTYAAANPSENMSAGAEAAILETSSATQAVTDKSDAKIQRGTHEWNEKHKEYLKQLERLQNRLRLAGEATNNDTRDHLLDLIKNDLSTMIEMEQQLGITNGQAQQLQTLLAIDPTLGIDQSSGSPIVSFGKGFAQGFFIDGLGGTLGLIGDAFQAIGTGLQGIWWSLTHPFEARNYVAEQYVKLETALFKAGEKAPEIIAITKNIALELYSLDPVVRIQVLMGESEGVGTQLSPELRLVSKIIGSTLDTLNKELQSLSPNERSELIGRIAGNVVYEVAEAVALNVVGGAFKAGKGSKLLIDAQDLVKSTKTKKVLALLAEKLAWLTKTRMCFVAGTMVHTAEGLKKIEEIQPGDMVLTRPEEADGFFTEPIYKPVLQTFETHPNELFHVTYRTESGMEETLVSTGGHPFYVIGKQEFVPVFDLNVDDELSLPNGETAVVTSINNEQAKPGVRFTTYNFAVSDHHTYFVGEAGVWVHNSSNVHCMEAANKFADNMDKRGVDEAFEILQKELANKIADGDITAGYFRQHLDDALDFAIDQEKIDLDIKKLLLESLDEGTLFKKSEIFKKILTKAVGKAPEWMKNPHAHHILLKVGKSIEAKKLVKKGQALLRGVGIDPIFGTENLVWAEQYAVDIHSEATVRKIVDALQKAKDKGGSKAVIKKRMIQVLKRWGEIASNIKV